MGSDLLELARLEGGDVQAQPEWVPADDLVREALEPVLDALRAHRLDLRVPPEATVWCDVRLCSQVIANLVLNAAQHGPAGGAIEIAIEVEPGRWHLAVRDEGPGWTGDGPLTPPPGGASRRAPRAARADAPGGSGLGLAICEVVARLHGGTLGVRHARGACIAMTLPLPGPPPALEGAA
jgi:two-component system sensor histidine kinase KdpD